VLAMMSWFVMVGLRAAGWRPWRRFRRVLSTTCSCWISRGIHAGTGLPRAATPDHIALGPPRLTARCHDRRLRGDARVQVDELLRIAQVTSRRPCSRSEAPHFLRAGLCRRRRSSCWDPRPGGGTNRGALALGA